MNATAHSPEFSSLDFADAQRQLPDASEAAWREFAGRQSECRWLTRQLLDFYRKYPCRMARLHMLTAPAVTLGRFWGHSVAFAAMGKLFMPVNRDGSPATPEWKRYIAACDENLPVEARDELWLVAHMADFEQVRERGLIETLQREVEAHRGVRAWAHIQAHMETTLGARLFDHAALSGEAAYETAVAHSMTLAIRRLLGDHCALIRFYLGCGVRAFFSKDRPLTHNHLAYRKAALAAAKNLLLCFSARKVWLRGRRLELRGADAPHEGWPLLESVLGSDAAKVDPMILAFYGNPARFKVLVSVAFHTLPAKLWSRAATLLTGQGLHESSFEQIDARFRVYRRSDGSMHFVRELYCGGRLRLFDSDFVIRQVNGKPTFCEVFTDLKTEVQMEVVPLDDGGLQIVSRHIFVRGLRMPSLGLIVDFRSHVRDGHLAIAGTVTMQPRTSLGRFFAYHILRRPQELARIQYDAMPMERV